jgi:hypothetical protein
MYNVHNIKRILKYFPSFLYKIALENFWVKFNSQLCNQLAYQFLILFYPSTLPFLNAVPHCHSSLATSHLIGLCSHCRSSLLALRPLHARLPSQPSLAVTAWSQNLLVKVNAGSDFSSWASAPKGPRPSHLITYGHSFCLSIHICTSVCMFIRMYVHPSVCMYPPWCCPTNVSSHVHIDAMMLM